MLNGEKVTLSHASVVIDGSSRITLDGCPVPLQSPQTLSLPGSANPSLLQAQTLFVERPRLWLVSKRSGELMADKDDEKKRPLLFDRLHNLIKAARKTEKGDVIQMGSPGATSSVFDVLKPVTRLEFTVEGLALFSNNGLISRVLESSPLERVYRVRTHGLITPSKKEGLRKGLVIDGVKQPSMSLSVELTKSTISWVNVKSNKSISKKSLKKSFEKMHLKALRMIQVQFGPFKLAELNNGQVAGSFGVDYKEVDLHRISNVQQLLQKANLRKK